VMTLLYLFTFIWLPVLCQTKVFLLGDYCQIFAVLRQFGSEEVAEKEEENYINLR
jgi:hypothetical protein